MAHDIYDDHEQGERVRKWLSENSSSIIIGLIAAFGAAYGWQKYQSYGAEQKVQAAQTYTAFETSVNAEQLDAAEAKLAQLKEHYSENLFKDLAILRFAAEMVEADQLDRATSMLSELRSSQHVGIADVASLRLARIYIARDQAQQALTTLDSVNKTPEFEAALEEVRGDALMRLGRMDEARTAYEAAVAAVGGTPRQALDMKLEKLKAGDAPAAMEQTS